MVVFDCIYTRFWYELKKNHEVMVEEDVCQIPWRALSRVRYKRDFLSAETNLVHNV